MSRIGSYSSETHGARAFLIEAWSLYRGYSLNLAGRVHDAIEDARRVEARVLEHCGVELKDLDVLEIGPGQFLSQMTCLAARNRVLGVDRDLIVRGLHPRAYLQMLRTNGLRRTAKTLGRKLLGIDRRYARELQRQLALPAFPDLRVMQMDVRDLRFPDCSFDFVFSRSVLHHLSNPIAALHEISRVLKPGGVAYISIHLYTSPTGSLDPRVYTERRGELAAWPHLRPHLAATVSPANVYLNRLRLVDWRQLFAHEMPNVHCLLVCGDPGLESVAQSLHGEGELLDYSLEELLTFEIVALWKKPLLHFSTPEKPAQKPVLTNA